MATLPSSRRPWLHLKLRAKRRRENLPDLAPDRHGIMRWPNGDVWIPQPQPPRTTGLFGHTRPVDRRNHTLAAASQIRALNRHTQHLQREVNTALITRAQADAWAGQPLTDSAIERLGDCIPHSSIPDTIGTIVDSWHD
ncbi:hypothetical protein [Mycobacterium simulans]|nr:hypothetical protein [Mycobacterium simulans]